MTISDYSKAIVDAMLGWLKGLANWVLRLFNLAGSGGGSPLLWLSQNWLKLLIVLMIVGVGVDLLVWLVRWRPHWVWFRRTRVIVNDDRFFDESDIQDKLNPDDDELERNWEERDYVVASTMVSRMTDRPAPMDRPVPGRRRSARRPERYFPGGSVQRGEKRRRPVQTDAPHSDFESDADLFGLDGSRPGVTDFYEDEVFNVNNLPTAMEYASENDESVSSGQEPGDAIKQE